MEGTIRKTYLLYKGYSGSPFVAPIQYRCTFTRYTVSSLSAKRMRKNKNRQEQMEKKPRVDM
jgi:hypothetical protein